MQESLNILIADDHSLVREGLKAALGQMPISCNVIEAASAHDVLDVMSICDCVNLIVLDLTMPGVKGFDLLQTLCNTFPDVPLVVLSADEEPQTMQRVIEYGAAGFIPKSAAGSILSVALQRVLAGGVYIPPKLQGIAAAECTPDDAAAADKKCLLERFTDRQIDVLKLVAGGQTNKEVARRLGLSEHTIKIHLSAAFKTLDVSNRTEAAIACRELKLFDSK